MTEQEIKELRLSVSKTKCFNQCRKQFEYNYILKLPKKDHDYHIFGKFCHKVLEDFHRSYIKHNSTNPYNIEMSKAFKEALLEYKDGMTAEMKKDCWEIINKYLKIITENKKNNLLTNLIDVERNFSFNIGNNVILNGMIDRIQIDDDNVLHVADYKTTKNKKYLKNDWFQLLTYAYILVSEDPSIQKVRGSYVLLRHDFEYITKDFSIDEIMEVKEKYLEYANQIRNEKEYPATVQILCRYCDYVDICSDGRKMMDTSKIHGEVNW